MAAVAVLAATPSVASAETLLMPGRDMSASTPEVVWGVTTLPNAGSSYTLDFGDASSTGGAVTDRSYITANHTYASSGTYTVTLTVTNGATVEVATTTVNVYNTALLSVDAKRELNVNRAIQDGLRYLWYSQANRTTFDTTIETYWDWGSFDLAGTALAAQAFQNQGFRLPNSNIAPTGIFPKYAVRRALNYILARLTTGTAGTTKAGNNACQVYADCGTLYANTTTDGGYENGMSLLAIAGSGAMARTNTEVTAANVVGKSYGEILQRMVNASIFGQLGGSLVPGYAGSSARGGWTYVLGAEFYYAHDGSTDGWELLGLLDAEAAGAIVPQFVRDEWNHALLASLNSDGSFDYQSNANPADSYAVNVAKTGVGIQGMFYAGRLATDPDLANAKTWLKDRWANQAGGQSFICGNSTYNKGCSYGMFNVFKGFKLFGITTVPGIGYTPAAGSTVLADDWYADYVDWLVANQTSQTSTTGGYWSPLYFSSQTQNAPANAAIALLILSPTALVLPDPVQFASLGLQQGSPLSINPATNPVTTPPGTHTVTGITVATNGSPIPGVTLTFKVLSGPNAGLSGTGVTGADGKTTYTYTDNGGAGTDNIQANVGALQSNILVKNWVAPVMVCDMNNDNQIDRIDIGIVAGLRNTTPASPNWNARADADFNGIVNSVDTRICSLQCTKPACAP